MADGRQSLSGAARAVLSTAQPAAKAALSRRMARAWRAGRIADVGRVAPPPRPARPSRPALLRPGAMPRRRAGHAAGRVALLHALAHIELNAIDLAWDLVGRFAALDWPRAFYDDWVDVAEDEARHFDLLARRLAALGAAYGDLPAHDGLWEAAANTAGDALARLAVVPLVLEARGLDVTPAMSARLGRAGDAESAALIDLIGREEVAHVAAGWRWFVHLCGVRALPPAETYRALVRRYHRAGLKPPFNQAARRQAGLEPALYTPLVA